MLQNICTKLLYCVLFLIVQPLAYAQEQSAIILLNPKREYLPDTFLERPKEWLGLYCQNKTCELKKIESTIKRSKSQSEGVFGNEDVDLLKFKQYPLAALQNINNLYESFVSTHYLNTTNTPILFDKKGYWSLPSPNQHLSIVKRLSTKSQGYRYFLQNSQQKQWLFDTDLQGHYETKINPIITWIGDLDGDNLVDFIIDLGDMGCSFSSLLFLSSMAKPNDFVFKAAEYTGTVPACGC